MDDLYQTVPDMTFNEDGTIKQVSWKADKKAKLLSIAVRKRLQKKYQETGIVYSKSYLSGVALASESIRISEYCNLRRLKQDDFIETYYPDSQFNTLRNTLFTGLLPTAILEMKTKISADEHWPGKAQLHIEKGIMILRLFKTGPVTSLRTQLHGGGTLSSSRYPLREYYVLSKKNAKKLRAFWAVLERDLPNEFIWNEKTLLAHAFRRYSEEFLYGGREEDRVSSAIMILEMLYTGQKLVVSNRAAAVLGYMGNNPIEIRDFIDEAYLIRNKYVHGSILDKELSEKASRIRPKIFDIVRKSILGQLYLKDRSTFIGKLDDSLIDPKAQEEVKGLLSTNRIIPIIKNNK